MRQALILVDVIQAFFAPTGANYKPEYDAVLDEIRQILAEARRHGVQIFHTREYHRANVPDFEWKKLPEHCLTNTSAVEPPEGITIDAADIVVNKRRYSAFFATDFDLTLRELGIGRLFLVGVKTHNCVRATVQDAFGYGYDPIVIREGVGSNYTHLHEASLEDIERYMGRVASKAECFEMFKRRIED